MRSGASIGEVNAAYQRLMGQYRPDKLAQMSPELRELAEQRMREIEAAYAALKRRAGG